MQPPSPLPLQGALLRPRITQPNFPTSWVHTKGRRGLVGGGTASPSPPASPQPEQNRREQRGERLRGEGWALPAARADKGTPTHGHRSPTPRPQPPPFSPERGGWTRCTARWGEGGGTQPLELF